MKKVVYQITLLCSLLILPFLVNAQSVQGEKVAVGFFKKVSFGEIVAFQKANEHQTYAPFKAPNPKRRDEDRVDQSDIPFAFGRDLTVNNTRDFILETSSPAPDDDFLGCSDSGGSIPPDVNGAVGPNHIMVTLNTEVVIQNRDGQQLEKVTLSSFFNQIPNKATVFDPKILYDEFEDRWIFTCCDGSTPNKSRLLFAVSENSNPTGDWNMYTIDADPTDKAWLDYPSMGFNKRWIAISGNMFGSGYYSVVFVIKKQDMYDGISDPQISRLKSSQGSTIVPAVTHDEDEEDLYCFNTKDGYLNNKGYLRMFLISGDTEDPNLAFLGSVSSRYTWADNPDANNNFLPQKGSSRNISAVDTRMQKVILRNGKLYATHEAFRPYDNPKRCAVSWWEISKEGDVLQHGMIEDPENKVHYAFPNMEVNSNGDMIIGMGIFSNTQYAGSAYAYRAYYDPKNTIRKPNQYKDGKASYYKTYGGARNRWGDYSAAALDPKNDRDFWVLQEYAETSGYQDRWGTWWASIPAYATPHADFMASDVVIPIGAKISFTDLSKYSPNSWNWTLQGGVPNTSEEQHPSEIQFNNEGSFKITLKAKNAFGSNTAMKQAYIEVSSTIEPIAAFSASFQGACLTDTVQLFDESEYVPNAWTWEVIPNTYKFVNGSSATDQNPQLVFLEEGVYDVKLLVNNGNATNELTKPQYIHVKNYIFDDSYKLRETFDEDLDLMGWKIENEDQQIAWEQVMTDGGENRAMRVNLKDPSSLGQNELLISPKFSYKWDKARLSFSHAYATTSLFAEDILNIYYKADCSKTWKKMSSLEAKNLITADAMEEDFIPTADDWCEGNKCKVLNLYKVAENNIQFAFEIVGGGGNAFYIDNIFLEGIVGLDETNFNNEVAIFPNPSSGIVKVKIPRESQIENLFITDVLGKNTGIDYAINDGSLQFNLTDLPNGVYLLNYDIGDGLKTEKLVLKK